MTGGFPSQRASNAENVSIWWRHHELSKNGDNTWGGLVTVRLEAITWNDSLQICYTLIIIFTMQCPVSNTPWCLSLGNQLTSYGHLFTSWLSLYVLHTSIRFTGRLWEKWPILYRWYLERLFSKIVSIWIAISSSGPSWPHACDEKIHKPFVIWTNDDTVHWPIDSIFALPRRPEWIN